MHVIVPYTRWVGWYRRTKWRDFSQLPFNISMFVSSGTVMNNVLWPFPCCCCCLSPAFVFIWASACLAMTVLRARSVTMCPLLPRTFNPFDLHLATASAPNWVTCGCLACGEGVPWIRQSLIAKYLGELCHNHEFMAVGACEFGKSCKAAHG